MARKRAHGPEEIVTKLRQVEVLTGQGKTVAEAILSETPARLCGFPPA